MNAQPQSAQGKGEETWDPSSQIHTSMDPLLHARLNDLSGEGLEGARRDASVSPHPPAHMERPFLFPLYFSAGGEEGKCWRGADQEGRRKGRVGGRKGVRENK